MKEHPILFKGEMVRALLNGTKTQTRRTNLKTKYVVGDRLWVKETWTDRDNDGDLIELIFRADGKEYSDGNGFLFEPKWKSSLFMSRKQSRILLEITALREENLNDITEEDAKEEGAELLKEYLPMKVGFNYRQAYGGLWESINGPGSWDENPVVKVISFKVVKS